RRVEGEDDGAIETAAREQPQLGALVGQAEQRHLRPEEAARMRLEGERCGWPGECAGTLTRSVDQGAMTAIHAVEIADGNDRAGQRRGRRGRPAVNGEGLLCGAAIGHRTRASSKGQRPCRRRGVLGRGGGGVRSVLVSLKEWPRAAGASRIATPIINRKFNSIC